jgi:hypothetical protein
MDYQVYTLVGGLLVSHGKGIEEVSWSMEGKEMDAVGGQQQLRGGIVYSSVMALPAPTAPPRPGISVMH